MGLGRCAQGLAGQSHPGPHPSPAADGGRGPDPKVVLLRQGSGPGRSQRTVQPSASRRALWIAVAAMAASAPATAIWFSPRTTSPAA